MKKQQHIKRTEYKHSAKTVRLSIDCSPEERKTIRILAAMEDKSMGEFMLSLARERFQGCPIGHHHIPNAATVASIEASEKGEGIMSFTSADEMFKYLHSSNDESEEKTVNEKI
jgi:hypothetical protein